MKYVNKIIMVILATVVMSLSAMKQEDQLLTVHQLISDVVQLDKDAFTQKYGALLTPADLQKSPQAVERSLSNVSSNLWWLCVGRNIPEEQELADFFGQEGVVDLKQQGDQYQRRSRLPSGQKKDALEQEIMSFPLVGDIGMSKMDQTRVIVAASVIGIVTTAVSVCECAFTVGKWIYKIYKKHKEHQHQQHQQQQADVPLSNDGRHESVTPAERV